MALYEKEVPDDQPDELARSSTKRKSLWLNDTGLDPSSLPELSEASSPSDSPLLETFQSLAREDHITSRSQSPVASSSKLPSKATADQAQNNARSALIDTQPAIPLLVPASVQPLSADEVKFYATRGHPMNKSGFRYSDCGPVLLQARRTRDRARSHSAGDSADGSPASEIPFYRLLPSPPLGVRFSWEDRSPYTYISEDALTITTDKGFRSARVNVPLREGSWYFEWEVLRGGGDNARTGQADAAPGSDGMAGSAATRAGASAHVRLGLARREATMNAPVGYDGYSYGLRDKTGDKITLSKPESYGEPFKTGDIIGVYVSLPTRTSLPDPDDPDDPRHLVRKRMQIRYRGHFYFESMEYVASKEMTDLADLTAGQVAPVKPAAPVKAAAPGKKAIVRDEPPPPRELKRLPGSRIAYFKNGRPMGVAFEDLFDYVPLRPHPPSAAKLAQAQRQSLLEQLALDRTNHHDDGTLGYYPAASVYFGGTVRLAVGPHFAYPPPANIESLLYEPEDAVGSPDAMQEDVKPRLGPSWRPLADRFDEYYREQGWLDDEDQSIALAKHEDELATAAKEARRTAIPGKKPLASSVNGRSKMRDVIKADDLALHLVAELAPETALELPPEVQVDH
ncbi:uncharacterized protein L969DRAFT_79636 [Mixia osmundae IAM 14324]|uniref:B30.2/SPRY domain-containing protein n=1 Tax=Mixia osmundae (strain CBS 9802 / IAM 14324 / JCM 22182 / KY 12970) TaxID=764103 RepID=G7E1L0_MIXOS|nr:uncharacterized protein L969DRAFT_79636 [Mixia osmundae IAM 14324]KEI36672.1 hypothetical protein L969DRAFT_79636 [Mixia osmundae IAM 14324]GAA96720.1 hypothetical protein E5Q_03391 [Mixia osmundae IAM 14324]